jgi:hypothetical protein
VAGSDEVIIASFQALKRFILEEIRKHESYRDEHRIPEHELEMLATP